MNINLSVKKDINQILNEINDTTLYNINIFLPVKFDDIHVSFRNVISEISCFNLLTCFKDRGDSPHYTKVNK